MYKRNNAALSYKYCCRGKAVSIIYSERVSVILPYLPGMQYQGAVKYCHLRPVWFYTFPRYSTNSNNFGKKLLNTNVFFFVFSTTIV